MLTIVEKCSRFLFTFPSIDIYTETVIKCLETLFALFSNFDMYSFWQRHCICIWEIKSLLTQMWYRNKSHHFIQSSIQWNKNSHSCPEMKAIGNKAMGIRPVQCIYISYGRHVALLLMQYSMNVSLTTNGGSVISQWKVHDHVAVGAKTSICKEAQP